MSTEPETTPTPETGTPPEPGAAGAKTGGPAASVLEELTTLGQKLATTIQTAINSPQWHQVENEVREGFSNIVQEVNEALAKARASETAKQLEERAAKAVEAVRTGKVTADLRENLVKGLKVLNRELDEIITRLESKGEPPASGQ